MTAVVAAGAPPGGGRQSGWVENFDGPLDPNFWTIANGPAPGRIFGSHIGYSQPDRVSVEGGYLVLRLTQEDGTVDGLPGYISRGGRIYTTRTYGPGIYEMRMRMSSDDSTPDTSGGNAVPGSVSAGFLYINNSKTEIDVEVQTATPTTSNLIYFTNWKNTNPNSPPVDGSESTSTGVPLVGLRDDFKTYKFIWTKSRISYYVDDVLQAVHTTNVPTNSANFMFSHWGSNSPYWGGLATPGATRYFYVDWVKYTPQ